MSDLQKKREFKLRNKLPFRDQFIWEYAQSRSLQSFLIRHDNDYRVSFSQDFDVRRAVFMDGYLEGDCR